MFLKNVFLKIWKKAQNGTFAFKVGWGILYITSPKLCLQIWPWFGRSLFSTNFVEFNQAV